MSMLIVESKRAKALLDLCDSSDISTEFTISDIDSIVEDSSLSEAERLRQIKNINRSLHELLYSPPRM